jgi:hypothetical protein
MLHLPRCQRYSVSVVLFHWILRLVVSAQWVLVVGNREWRGLALAYTCPPVAVLQRPGRTLWHVWSRATGGKRYHGTVT